MVVCCRLSGEQAVVNATLTMLDAASDHHSDSEHIELGPGLDQGPAGVQRTASLSTPARVNSVDSGESELVKLRHLHAPAVKPSTGHRTLRTPFSRRR